MIKRVTDPSELAQIKALQVQNLRTNIPKENAFTVGFVSAQYSIDTLTKLHNIAPSIIAKAGDRVVGYIIVTLDESRTQAEILDALFTATDKYLKRGSYAACGQLCVGEGYRGKGISTRMYKFFQQECASQYESVVTDIHRDNVPSLRAHQKVGFRCIAELAFETSLWDLVVWSWRDDQGQPASTQ